VAKTCSSKWRSAWVGRGSHGVDDAGKWGLAGAYTATAVRQADNGLMEQVPLAIIPWKVLIWQPLMLGNLMTCID
jgi:hypothetical protein